MIRFAHLRWVCLLALLSCAPAAFAQNTRVTGTFKTQDQLTPEEAGLKVLRTVGATPVYGSVLFQSVDTGRANQPREITCNVGGTNITHPPQLVPGWIKADGTLMGGDEVAGVLLIPTEGCSPSGLAYKADIKFTADATGARAEFTLRTYKAIPATPTVDWATLPVAAAATSVPVIFYQQILDEGVARPQRPAVNYIGSGVSCVDNPAAARTDCTITGGGGGGSTHQIDGLGLTSQDPINFLDTSVFDWTNPAAGNLSLAIKTNSLTGTMIDEATLAGIAQSSITNLVTDLGAKQPLDADLTALAALGSTGYSKRTGADAWSLVGTIPETDLDAALLRDAEAAALYLPFTGGTLTGTLTVRAGATGAGSAPMKFQAGSLLTTPEAHAFEWDGANLFVTQATGPTRKTLAFTDSNITGNAATATALAADPADCSANQYATAIAASGALTCAQVNFTQLGGQIAVGQFPDDVVTYAKIQNVSATARLLGRITAGAGDIEELTGTQATTLLDVFTSTLKGLAPASGGGTTNFLRADGTWAAPPGGGSGCNPGGLNNQLLTSDGAGACVSEANFTFDGATLGLTGNQTISGFLAFGADPADAGAIRISNNTAIVWEHTIERSFFVDATGKFVLSGDVAGDFLSFEPNNAGGGMAIRMDTDDTGVDRLTFQLSSNQNDISVFRFGTGLSGTGQCFVIGSSFGDQFIARGNIGVLIGAGASACTDVTRDLTVRDSTATTGVTQVAIQAGAGQGATNLLEFLTNAGGVLLSVDSAGGLNSILGTITTSNPHLDASATLNAAGIAFMGIDLNWTVTAAHGGSRPYRYRRGGVERWGVAESNGGMIQLLPASGAALSADVDARTSAGQTDSPWIELRGSAFDSAEHEPRWRVFVDLTSNAGASSLGFQSDVDAAGLVTRLSISDAGVIGAATFNASSGFQVGGAALNFSHLAGTIALAQTPLTTAGDLLYANGTPALARLGIGSNGQCLMVVTGAPGWDTCPGGGGGGDSITINGAAVTDADFDDADPAAVTDGLNVKWQLNNTASPDSISAYILMTGITKVGTITAGVWNGTGIAIADGGTGGSTATAARSNLGVAFMETFSAADGQSPVDSTTYFIGQMGTPIATTITNQGRVYMSVACTVTRVIFWGRITGTLGSNETVNFTFQKNDSDTAITFTRTFDAADIAYVAATGSVALAVGDSINLKAVMPAFGTNPTGVRYLWGIQCNQDQ